MVEMQGAEWAKMRWTGRRESGAKGLRKPWCKV